MSEPFPITLLRCGVEFFPALIDAIRNAEREIFLETYIFQDDITGNKGLESQPGSVACAHDVSASLSHTP